MKYNFQNIEFLKSIYKNENLVDFRGNFLKKYSNRKYSLRDFIIRLLPEIKNKLVLDIGCGNCSFLEKLHKTYPNNRYYGLDIVKNRQCSNYRFLDYKIYDGENFSIRDKKFDLIFSMHTLYHVKDLNEFFINIKNLLKEGSILVITTKSKFTFPKIESIFQEIIREFNIKFTKERDEAKFCLENSAIILKDFFSKANLQRYILETQIFVDNFNELIKYTFSTQRYNPENLKDKIPIKRYLKLWQEKISIAPIFIDKYIEVIYLIKL